MIRSSGSGLVFAGVVALSITAAAAIAITPSSHDFGDAARQGIVKATFQVTVSGGPIALAVKGPDAADFTLLNAPTLVSNATSPCRVGPQGVVCQVDVDFHPQSGSVLGPKTARLEATDSRGNVATALLKGKVVAALCEMKVVFCNYAHLYTGFFDWNSGLSGPAGSYREQVHVNVVNGVASCTGSAIDVSNGRTRTGPISGPGLIAVEFVSDPVYGLAYEITAACPSPDWPATADEPATPSKPAELGHGEQSSGKQPAPQQRTGTDLAGQINFPSPDNDPLNGVSGTVSIGWDLKRVP